MSTFHGGPNIVTDGLVLHLDAGNIKSFGAEPTTNLTRNSKDVSGTQYALSDEWTADPTRLTKTYDSSIQTPVGTGATLIQESGNPGFHHLTRWGGSGTGSFSLSCYVRPITNDITDFSLGLLGSGAPRVVFNLVTGTISSNTLQNALLPTSNVFIEKVPNFSDWYRVGANIFGRSGGWVGCIGYSNAAYTGSLGAKQCYIAGIQYETLPAPTAFVEAQQTRIVPWQDRSRNNNIGTLVNGPIFDRTNRGSISFDGVNDYISVSNPQQLNPGSNSFTIDYWCKIATTIGPTSASCALEARSSTLYGFLCIAYRNSGQMQLFLNDNLTPSQNVYSSTTTPVQINAWNHQAMVVDRTTQQITFYYNGQQTGNTVTITDTGSIDPGSDYRYWVGGDLGGTPMAGNIANIRHYSRALSATEVQRNYEALRGRYGI